jgi:hypothetical protein
MGNKQQATCHRTIFKRKKASAAAGAFFTPGSGLLNALSKIAQYIE